jgi:hypothetical protein
MTKQKTIEKIQFERNYIGKKTKKETINDKNYLIKNTPRHTLL